MINVCAEGFWKAMDTSTGAFYISESFFNVARPGNRWLPFLLKLSYATNGCSWISVKI